jgi:hypothetical protein
MAFPDMDLYSPSLQALGQTTQAQVLHQLLRHALVAQVLEAVVVAQLSLRLLLVMEIPAVTAWL